MAHIIEVTEQDMGADKRCDRCGAQAHVEVSVGSIGLLFCGHHADEHWNKILTMDALVADHRPFLRAQEAKQPA